MSDFPSVTLSFQGSPLFIPSTHFRPTVVTESDETRDTMSTVTVSLTPSTINRPGGVPPLLKALVDEGISIIFEVTVILSVSKETAKTEAFVRVDPLSVFAFSGGRDLQVEDTLLEVLVDVQIQQLHP